MENKYTYKKQCDGRDSWVCEEPNGDKYMVYEDPFIIVEKKTDLSNIDIDSLTDEQLNEMKYNELQLTDWCFIRKSELGIEVPQEILDERDSIRKKYNDLKANVK